MKKLIEMIKKKWITDTFKTCILIVLLIAAFLGINIGVKKLDLMDIDITPEKIYSLSEESKEKIKNIDDEIMIYLFGYTEESLPYTLGRQYHNEKENITVELVDSQNNPELLEEYGIEQDIAGIVIRAGEREKVLGENDLYTYDYTTYETIDITEQKITNTIIDLTLEEKPQIYFITGHNEYSLSSDLQMFGMYLLNDVNEIHEIDLLTSNIPEDCDVLVIMSPEKDFIEYESDLVKDYINKGGNILWLNDTTTTQQDFPNIQSILDLYGITFKAGIVKETDANKMPLQDARFIKPEIYSHTITKNIATDGGVMLIQAGRIEIVDDDKIEELNLNINYILKASDTSYIGEEAGPFITGLEVEKQMDENTSSKLVAYSNNSFISDGAVTIGNTQLMAISLYNNKDLILNTVAYLTNREDSIVIRKDTGTITYTATQMQDTVIRIIIFTIPVLIVIAGIVVWQVRRRKK